jgi:probable F420-dependent oxidoreductase
MDIAFSPSTPFLGPRDLVDLSVEAEGLGYSGAWLAEVSGPETFALAGAIAARTERIDLGVAVVPAATRSPALLAMGAATVSGLLGGRRFDLGIGSSSRVIVEDWHDRDFSPPVRRVDEAVRATRSLLGGERSFDGETVSVDRFRLGTAAAGPIGLYVGALGPRMLRLAGAIGDGVCLNLMTVDAVATQLAEIERGAGAAERELPGDFGVMARFHVAVTDDLAAGRAMIRGAFGPYFAQPVYNRFLAWMGYEAEADAIRDAFGRGDREGVATALHDEIIDGITLVGGPGRIRARLEEYEAAGVGIAALNLLVADRAAAGAALEALAPSA